MDNKQQINKIGQLVEEELQEMPSYFLVEVKLSASGNVKVFIDADEGVSVDRLARLNRSLYKKIVANGVLADGDFSLEISSPGLDEPLKMQRQYQKNIGRKVEVQQVDGQKKEGLLKSLSEEAILLEVKTGKKETGEIEIPFNQIKYTKVCVVF